MYVMGFDYGSKRIGVAVGQTITYSARPLTTVLVHNLQIDWQTITALIQEWQPDALVIGLPLQFDGSESEIAIAARRFSRKLEGRYQLPIHLIDETLSSVAAAERMPTTKNQKKIYVDAMAAQIILETWLVDVGCDLNVM